MISILKQSLFVIFTLLLSWAALGDNQGVYSPHQVKLEQQVRWRGSWGNTRVYDKYLISAQVDGKEVAEFMHNYYLGYDRFKNEAAHERLLEDVKHYEQILKQAKEEVKLVRVKETNDRWLKDGIEILEEDDLVHVSEVERETIRCLTQKIVEGDPKSSSNRKNIDQLEKLLAKIRARY